MSWAVVTGASRGIGAAIVNDLLKNYPSLSILAISRNIENSTTPSPSNVTNMNADVSCQEGRQKIVDFMSGKQLLYLFNNAGIIDNTSWDALDEATFDSLQATNVKGPLFLTNALTFQSGARIVNIGSGGSFFYFPPCPFYCISKASLFMCTKIMNEHLNPQGAYAAHVMPGVIDTEMIYQGEVNKRLTSPAAKPEVAARFLVWLLSADIPQDEFATKSWDLYDAELQERWVTEGIERPVFPFGN